MKRIIFSAVMIVFMTFTISAQNFGYCNSRALLLEMPEMAQATSELEVLAKQLQKQGEDMVSKLQAEYTVLEQEIAAGNLSKIQQEEEAKKFQEKQQQLSLFDQEMSLQIQKKEAELLEPILKRLNDAITAVAKENQFQFIFDQGTQMLLFAEQSTDVSSMVKSKLGI
jgi:outer membrane protein